MTTKGDAAIEHPNSPDFDALGRTDIIASGYEFDCPNCDTYNTLIAIPKYRTAVECHECHKRFAIGEPLDAFA